MSRQNRNLIAVVALAIIGVGVGLLALFRVQQAKEFRRPHRVQMRGGTNYVMQLVEVAVGKIDTGCVLIVYMRLENSNPFEVTLRRDRFMLVGQDRDYHQPSTMGTQSELIKLPANGVLEREMLSYTVADDVVAGALALRIGRNNLILLKDRGSLGTELQKGEFRAFRRPNW
jgi:hypothetical protein